MKRILFILLLTIPFIGFGKDGERVNQIDWPEGLVSECEKMLSKLMYADPIPDEVQSMLTDLPTYEEIAKCVCNTMQEKYPKMTDIEEIENISVSDSELVPLLTNCMGEDFKKLIRMIEESYDPEDETQDF